MNWSADKLTDLATGYWQSAALIAAVQVGLFDHLDEPMTSDQIAAHCGAAPETIAALLDALASLELLIKRAGLYSLDPTSKPLLCKSSPTCMLDALRYNADLYQRWGSLGGAIAGNKSLVAPAGTSPTAAATDETRTRRFVMGMESKARAFLPAIAPLIHLNSERTLLDVGSGPGTLSRHFAESDRSLHVTLFDLPDVLRVTREICANSAAYPRLEFCAGDYRREALPKPFDAILFAGALHQETPESAKLLSSRFYDSLAPGGRLFVVDLMLDDDRTHPRLSALFQLTMLLIQPGARVFSQSELSAILLDRGFELQTTEQPVTSPYRIIIARKPESA
ncbi:MAG: methyltransferase domain-containing protein [Burkholderiales bacterium]|nr:methyltransferase domain-containing protein [Phycisphaerae bacterium]